MRSVSFFFLILISCAFALDGNDFLPAVEKKLENQISKYAGGLSKWLESFNDQHLGKSELGRFLHYDEIKSQLEGKKNVVGNESRSMKKMGMMMMPLIFHIGATSTWMLITTVLTAKSLAVGLLLLIFKIAVSSAKLAAFFTHLKSKHPDHHEWAHAWTPHYEHHDHHLEHHPEHHGTISHIPEWKPNDIPHYHDFKNNEFHDFKHNEIHDFKNHEFHDFKNNEIHDFNFKPHEFHEYNTIPHEIHSVHDTHGFGDFHDFNHFEGAKKKIDTKVG